MSSPAAATATARPRLPERGGSLRSPYALPLVVSHGDGRLGARRHLGHALDGVDDRRQEPQRPIEVPDALVQSAGPVPDALAGVDKLDGERLAVQRRPALARQRHDCAQIHRFTVVPRADEGREHRLGQCCVPLEVHIRIARARRQDVDRLSVHAHVRVLDRLHHHVADVVAGVLFAVAG